MKRPSHTAFKKKALARPGVRAAYDALAEEFAFIDELLRARQSAHKSQADVAHTMKTTTSVISRLESSGGAQHHSPSLSTLRRYASAVGCKLQLKLVPSRTHALHF